MGSLLYKDFPKPKWLNPINITEFEQLISLGQWAPLQEGERVLIRDPWLLSLTQASIEPFYSTISTRIGRSFDYPGKITGFINLDDFVKSLDIPGPEDIVKVKSVAYPDGHVILENYRFIYLDIWLIRESEWKQRKGHTYIPTTSRQLQQKYECPLCGSKADALFVGCCCSNSKCSNWRK